jgi:sodium/potassium-transporting ATPase subunit alpha
VKICRGAGIKVIMVTGDQPPTAAAIAQKVNIITDPTLEYNYLVDEVGLSKKEAWAKSKAIVIHGDKLARKHAKQAHLDENDPEKGRYLIDWISKPEVVFARTTPSQKLLIVDACQKLGHIVAVTGDGVNDSPAIKKADIGIAMGSGSEVAKNAADLLLLTDDFTSIVAGVEAGRLMYDNLKKCITYALTANAPELMPVFMFLILQIPLPLSAILMLAISIGTDMWPAISLAYERSELDIMKRMPRSPKRDHLVTLKTITQAYLEIGLIEAMAGFFAYFTAMNDYGYKIDTLLYLNNRKGYFPNSDDIYDPNIPNYGNSNYGNQDKYSVLDWGQSL